jgi:hypothetical protein
LNFKAYKNFLKYSMFSTKVLKILPLKPSVAKFFNSRAGTNLGFAKIVQLARRNSLLTEIQGRGPFASAGTPGRLLLCRSDAAKMRKKR